VSIAPKMTPCRGPSKPISLEVVILLLLTLQSIPNVALTGTFQSPRVKESSGTDDSTFVLTGEAD